MTDPKQDVQDVRAQFEAWAEAAGYYVGCLTPFEKSYISAGTKTAWNAYQAALQSPAVRELVDAKRKYAHLCAAFNDMKTSTSERFLECLGIEDDVCKPLDEILNTALRTLGAGHVE